MQLGSTKMVTVQCERCPTQFQTIVSCPQRVCITCLREMVAEFWREQFNCPPPWERKVTF